MPIRSPAGGLPGGRSERSQGRSDAPELTQERSEVEVNGKVSLHFHRAA